MTGPLLRLIATTLLIATATLAAPPTGTPEPWTHEAAGYRFSWDPQTDTAQVAKTGTKATCWRGGLLPAFWVQLASGEKRYVKAEAVNALTDVPGGALALRIGDLGVGELEVRARAGLVEFTRLSVTWTGAAPRIISVWYGSAALTEEEQDRAPNLDHPFWPNWEAEGFCVPSAKGAPIQSFFRKWDFGHATLPLGSFGPSLGTPYAAAYPRPLFSLSMGGRDGWVVFGAGGIPDAAMVLRVQASSGGLEFLYREDLWAGPAEQTREWRHPLRITWAPTAYDAFQRYFQTFGAQRPVEAMHQRNVWNSWGDFKNKDFNLERITEKAVAARADVLVIDDLWETAEGSGVWHEGRFPNHERELQKAKARGLEIGFWQNVIWMERPDEYGLTEDDLLCGRDGRPVKTSWNMNPREERAFYCLDPSSENALAAIRQRTKAIVQNGVAMLKLDFGYGLPSPNVATARNSELRGEMLAYTLLKTVADAAREVNPRITIQYYSIHPLMRAIADLVALDDLGDAGNREGEGHGQWSIWSSLAAAQGTAIMASSGYEWESDADVLLNTAIVGSQGAVLPRVMNDGSPVPERYLTKRNALARWHRRTVGWSPLWLNSTKGSLAEEPTVRSWGRLELIGKSEQLTALALREDRKPAVNPAHVHGIRWSGRWVLIAQDQAGIMTSREVALIPFDTGTLRLPSAARPERVTAVYADREEAFAGWKWENGWIEITLDDRSQAEALVGLLVRRPGT